MTEAFIGWIREQISMSHTDEDIAFDIILAFVREVERRYVETCKGQNVMTIKAMKSTWRLNLYDELIREFGLDGEGE